MSPQPMISCRWISTLTCAVLLLFGPFSGLLAQTREITFSESVAEVRLRVEPKNDSLLEGEESVVIELLEEPANYVMAPQRVARMGLDDAVSPPDLLGFAPGTGLPGTLVTIRGHFLDQTTIVTFNGVPAAFTVDSPYQVTATVPATATSGPISVATPQGAITSAATFTVLQDGEWPGGWVDRNWVDRQRSDYGFDLNGVTYADGLYVAVGEFGIIRTSPDGVKWTMQESGYLGDLYAVTAGKLNGVNWFVAVGGGANREAGGVILTSQDGVNWVPKGTDRPMTAVAFGGGIFVVGGQNRVGRSVTATSWEFRESPGQDELRETFTSIAYGNGTFVASSALQSHDGRGHRIVWKSTTGLDWTLAVGRAGEWWYRYGASAYATGIGFLFVGHHSNGRIGGYASLQCCRNNITGAFYWSGDLDQYDSSEFWNQAAFDNNSGSWAHWSPDGVTWTERSKPDQVGLFGIAYGDDTFVAVGNSGAIRLTTDGQSWQSFQAPTAERLRAVTYGAGQFLAVGRKGVVVTSKSGVEWTLVRPAAPAFPYWSRATLIAVAEGHRGLVAVGGGQTVLISPGGSPWSAPLPEGKVDYIPGAFTFVEAKADSQARNGRMARSFPVDQIGRSGWLAGTDQGSEGTWRWDGTTNTVGSILWSSGQPDGAALENYLWWNGTAAEDRKSTDKGGYFIEYPDNQLAGDFRSVAAGAGRYVIVGTKTVLSSSDLKIWKRSNLEATNDFGRVRFLNGNFVAVGSSGALWISADGVTWASRNTGVAVPLLDVAYGAGRYVVVGEGGNLVHSADGVVWEKASTGITAPLRAVAFGNATFVAVGDGGVVLTSETGTGWRLRASSGKAFRFLEFAENRFLGGDGGAIFQSNDGKVWEPWVRHRDFTTIYDRKRTFNALYVGERSSWLVGDYSTILESSLYLPALPSVSVQLGDQPASEVGPRAGTFVLRRTGNLSKPLTIQVKIGGSATEPDDYQLVVPNVP